VVVCGQKFGKPKILCHFSSVRKNGLQKFWAKSYVSRLKQYDFVFAALNDLLRKFHGRKCRVTPIRALGGCLLRWETKVLAGEARGLAAFSACAHEICVHSREWQ